MDDQRLIGRLQAVAAREVWRHEALDFTPWLLSHADVLSLALGMDLELHVAEHPVGNFSLDLLGTADGAPVIVENQLAQSDHTHLGQILTYAGGTEPQTIVWLATSFRDEHRAAMDWLNRSTLEEIRFFAVEIGVVKIGASLPAPLFTVVVKPNDWGKSVKGGTTAEGVGLAYFSFWGQWLDLVHAQRPGWTKSQKPSKGSWMTLPAGHSDIWFTVAFTQLGVCNELYFGSSDPVVNATRFELALALRQELEAAFGSPLEFEGLDGKVSCRIRQYAPGKVTNESDWPSYLGFFLDGQTRLRNALASVGGVSVLTG